MSDWGSDQETWSEEENLDRNLEKGKFPKNEFFGFVSRGDFDIARKLLIDERASSNIVQNDADELINFINNVKWPKTLADGSTVSKSLRTLLLLELGSQQIPEIDVRDALFEFTIKGQKEYLSALLALKINSNLTDELGHNAVHFASQVEILKILRLAGADLFHMSDFGGTPVHGAISKNYGRILNYILSFTPDPLLELSKRKLNDHSILHCLLDCLKDMLESSDCCDRRFLTQLNLFKMMLSSISQYHFEVSTDEVKKASNYFLKEMKCATIEDLIDKFYDEAPTDEAREIEFVLKHVLTERPGNFPVVENQPIKLEPMQNNEVTNVQKLNQKFEHLDHTADIQIHSWGNDVKEAFENQILGMFEYMVPLERIENKQTIILEASAPNDKNMNELLFNFMQNALYEACTDPYFMAKEAKILQFDRDALKIRYQMKGENWDLQKHGGFGTEIKAVTYSAMKILEKSEKCEIWVVVDI